MLATGRAQDDFFTAYASGRGLTRIDGHTHLPPITPLLRKGDERYAEQRLNGVLPGGLDGSLCLYTYEEETRDSDGNKQTTYIHFTIVMTELPDDRAAASRSCSASAGSGSGSWTRWRTYSASASASSRSQRRSTAATRSSSARTTT